MTDKPVYIVGKYPHSKPKKGTPTQLLQAQTLGYLKGLNVNIPAIDIHETEQGFQIEIDQG